MLLSRIPCLRFVAVTSVVAVVLAVVPLPLHGVLSDAIQDALHALGFAAFAALLLRCAARSAPADPRRRVVVAFGVLLTLAVVTEGAQFFTPRDSNPGDFARDLLGIGMGTAAAALWTTRSAVRRRALVAVIVAGLVAVAVPVVDAVRAVEERARSLPLLHTFDRDWEHRFLHGRGVETWTERGNAERPGLLHVEYREGGWPTMIFRGVPPDWSAYDAVVIEVENTEDEPVVIAVRIDDRLMADPPYDDRFQRAFRLEPGWNTVRVPLDEVVADVPGHAFDTSRVASLAVFAGSGQTLPFTLRFDAIRLEGD